MHPLKKSILVSRVDFLSLQNVIYKSHCHSFT